MMRLGGLLIWLATAALVGAVAWFAVSGSPRLGVFSPEPWTVILPALFIEEHVGSTLAADLDLGALIPIVPVVVFLIVAFPLARGVERIPWPTLILFGLSGITCLGLTVATWSDGVEHQGRTYTASLAAMNLAAVALIAFQAVLGRRRPSFVKSCVFHASFFLWLFWSAFPWLGEGL